MRKEARRREGEEVGEGEAVLARLQKRHALDRIEVGSVPRGEVIEDRRGGLLLLRSSRRLAVAHPHLRQREL